MEVHTLAIVLKEEQVKVYIYGHYRLNYHYYRSHTKTPQMKTSKRFKY
jgi:hypothetical protein